MSKCSPLALLLFFVSGLLVNLHAQSIVRLTLPECTEPFETVLLQVEVLLEPGETLKSYDVRIQFDSTRVTLIENQMQQGNWFTSGGNTFFWHDIIGDLLYVNAALMGPGLHVTGNGILFTIPVELGAPTLADLDINHHTLFDVDAQLVNTLAVPAFIQAPCTEFNLQIQYLPLTQQALLEWDPQGWTQAYAIYASEDFQQSWHPLATIADTTYMDLTALPNRLYRLRSVFQLTP